MATSTISSVKEKEACAKYMPDFTAAVTYHNRTFDLFATEVKKPKQQRMDLHKLGSMLKVMLNDLVEARIQDPVVCGMIVDGKSSVLCNSFNPYSIRLGLKAKTYRMELRGKHQYAMIEMASFRLPEETSDFIYIPDATEALLQIHVSGCVLHYWKGNLCSYTVIRRLSLSWYPMLRRELNARLRKESGGSKLY